MAAGYTYYLLNAPRMDLENSFTSRLSNNELTRNKLEIKRMPKFNRKFLPEEIEQFLHNENVQTKGRKRYIYNPMIHGDDEDAFKEYFERMNSGEHRLTDDMIDRIREMNAAKKQNNESVQLVPWSIGANMI